MKVVGDFLIAAAESTPQATAFAEAGEERTYGELAADAGRLARALRDHGIGAGDRVGVALDGGYRALVSLHGILDAGAVYVPLGSTTPVQRIAAIAADAGLSAAVDGRSEQSEDGPSTAVLRFGASGKALFDEGAEILSWAELERGDGALGLHRVREDDPAYVFYTSGSTGTPKGVVHEHRSACAFAEWARSALITEVEDRVAAASAITFDISLLELLVPVARGATIVGIPRHLAIFPGAFAQAIAAAAPSVLQLVPQLWRGLLGSPEAPAGIRLGVVTGEGMPSPDWRALRAALPAARLFNLYGSTELNDCAFFELPPEWPESAGEIPVGRPVEGATLELLGAAGEACEDGTVGELVVSSPMSMRGYWNLEAETERSTVVRAGRRAFRTGDLARRDADGQLHLVGRADRSAKVGGEWVHLDEVESVAARHPAVTEVAAVLDEADGRPGVRLIAVTATDIDPLDLQRHCAVSLARPARPRRVELVEALPRNNHGKVEMAKL